MNQRAAMMKTMFTTLRALTVGALALGLLKGALACHRDMATFAQAGVSERSAG